MQAEVKPSRDVMKDIMAVEWLPLSAAVRRLSYPLEKLFLSNVGRMTQRQRRLRLRRRAHRHVAKSKLRRRGTKTLGQKPRSRRASSRNRPSKVIGHSAVRSARATILQRVLGRLS
jgi:hypothetical protein